MYLIIADLRAPAVTDLQHVCRWRSLQHLVQVQLHAESRPHRRGHPGLAELHRVPLPGQDDQLLHPHHAPPHLLPPEVGRHTGLHTRGGPVPQPDVGHRAPDVPLLRLADLLSLHPVHSHRQGSRARHLSQISYSGIN